MKKESITNGRPLWDKSPQEVSEEEYKEFYQALFPFAGNRYFGFT